MDKGYNPDFLRFPIEAPSLTPEGRQQAYRQEHGEVVSYTHFSLTLHTTRRLAIWVAWNIDGGQLKKLSRKNLTFRLDPGIPSEYQAGNELYEDNRLDRGHIARRADLCWGTEEAAQQANSDSFYFTNIAPQMDTFNQSSLEGIWGKLEDTLFAEAEVENLKVSVFGGPIFREDDSLYRDIQIPQSFFKVLVYVEEGVLKVKSFILTQNLDELELLALDAFKVYEVTLDALEQQCSFTFSAELKAAESAMLVSQPDAALIYQNKPIDRLDQIKW